MTLKISNKYLILVLLIAFAGIYVLGRYQGKVRAKRASNSVIEALTGKLVKYSYKIDSLTKFASEQQQIVVTQKQALQTALIQKEEIKKLHLKKVSEVTNLKAQLELLLDSIGHTGTVVVIKPCDTTNGQWQTALTLPIGFEERTKYYTLIGNMDENANLDIDLKVPVALDLWTGYNKKTKSYTATVTSDNPHFKVTEIRSIKVETPAPKKFGIGLQAGYGLILSKEKITAQPYIGAGVSWNLIRF